MSAYCHLCCIDCKEAIFVKDTDTSVHANPEELGQFLEKHYRHTLLFLHEDDGVRTDRGDEFPSDCWKRFKLSSDGFWSVGRFVKDNGYANAVKKIMRPVNWTI